MNIKVSVLPLVLTFKQRHQPAPAGDRALAMELPQRQLHVEQWDPAHHQHDAVWYQERP